MNKRRYGKKKKTWFQEKGRRRIFGMRIERKNALIFEGTTAQRRNSEAAELVKSLLPKRVGARDAVVFDIDDTLVQGEYDKRKQVISDLFDFVKGRGFKVFAVTARPFSQSNYDLTLQMLERRGFEVEELLMIPSTSLRRGVTTDEELYKYIFDEKQKKRRHIQRKYNIVLNVGDRFHDLIPSPPSIPNHDSKSVVFKRYGVLSFKVS